MDHSTITNQGKRDRDEDAIMALRSAIVWDGKIMETGAFALADGMGGCRDGEVASRIAVQEFGKEFAPILWGNRPLDDFRVREMLIVAFRQAQEAIQKYGARKGYEDTGTTLVAAVIQGRKLWAASIGDSAAFLYRTRDRSATYDSTYIEGEGYGLKRLFHPDRDTNGWLTRALSVSVEDPCPDIQTLTLNPGDIVCLCCDGVSETVPSEEIEKIIESSKNPEEICKILVDRAEKNGGTDNESAIVVKVDGRPIRA